MHKIALDDEKIALAHTIFNMIWKLAELIRSEFLKRMPVSEIIPERGLWITIRGLYYKAEYPLPVFFLYANKIKIGVELNGVFAVMLLDKKSITKEFIEKLLAMDLDFVAYGAENFVETLFNRNMNADQIMNVINDCNELMIQLEIKRDLKNWKQIINDVLTLLKITQEHDVKLYPIVFPEFFRE